MEEDQTIIETWTIQELEDFKWQLMLKGRAWEALAIQYQIDQFIINRAANFIWDEEE